MPCAKCGAESGFGMYCSKCAPGEKLSPTVKVRKTGRVSSLFGFNVTEKPSESTEEYLRRQEQATNDFVLKLQKEREETWAKLNQQDKETDEYIAKGQKEREEAIEKSQKDRDKELTELRKERQERIDKLYELRRKQQELIDKQVIEKAKSDGAAEDEAVRLTFKELAEPIGEGLWEIKALKVYYPPGPLEIPGTTFAELCPSQAKVNQEAVEFKIQKLPGTPVIPVVLDKDGRLILRDKHHTFVACMAIGRPVQLALTEKGNVAAQKDWMGCNWVPFEGKKKPLKGFSLPESAAHLEGEIEEPPHDWENVVPWLKGKPRTAKKVSTPEETKKSLILSEEGVDSLDDDTATKFHELLEGALQVEEVKEHFDKLLKVKGFKIKFDPEADGAYYSDKMIVLPTMKDGSPILDAADLIDALIFESCNVAVKDDYDVYDDKFSESGKSLSTYGEEKAGIEAAKVVLGSAQMTSDMKKKGQKIAQQGETNIASIEALDPGYFDQVEFDPVREEKLIKLLTQKMCSTKHVKAIDPDKDEKSLRDPRWLKSGEMYHYEKTKSLGKASFVILLTGPVFEKSPNGWVNQGEYKDWMGSCWKLCEKKREGLPLVFCLTIDALKLKFPAVSFVGLEFSGDMRRVAQANDCGFRLDPIPEIKIYVTTGEEDEADTKSQARLKELEEKEAKGFFVTEGFQSTPWSTTMKRAFDAAGPDRKCQNNIKNVATALAQFAANEPAYTREEDGSPQKIGAAVDLMENMNKILINIDELLKVKEFQQHDGISAYLAQFKKAAAERFALYQKVAEQKV